MNIEFYTPQGQVKEWLLTLVRDKLMEFHHRFKEITKAQVYFKEQDDSGDEKTCEITLTVYSDSIFVHRKAGSFEQACKDVLTELEEKVNEQIRKQNEPPDEITSTVKA